jgi:carboxypeptidase C (cathepsin A)
MITRMLAPLGVGLGLSCGVFFTLAAHAAQSASPVASSASAAAHQHPPFPPDASVRQTATVDGRVLRYTATQGSLPMRDEKGMVIAEVTYTAYTLDGAPPQTRPVTFAMNGGPGAPAIYLNLGAIGPKRLDFGEDGNSASDSPLTTNNPNTWLDFTDLVFVDPVDTGFSRSLLPRDEAAKRFYTVKADIEDVAATLYDWLLKHGRMSSPKYYVGESYSGFRGPKLARYLLSRHGISFQALVLVNPYLDGIARQDTSFSPMYWATLLPSYAAANLERQGKPLNRRALAEVEHYARGEYIVDLVRGATDPAALDRIVTKVSAYTGLPAEFVRSRGGRIHPTSYAREVHRVDARVGSLYDPDITSADPFPWSDAQFNIVNDPLLARIIAPAGQAMADTITRELGWKFGGRYNPLNFDVSAKWDNGRGIAFIESVSDLRQSLAADSRLRIVIAHGFSDLVTPYFETQLMLDQIPTSAGRERVSLTTYAGGHMFYDRVDSNAAFRRDIMQLYGAR